MKDINLLPDEFKKTPDKSKQDETFDFRENFDPKILWFAVLMGLFLIAVFLMPYLYNNFLTKSLSKINEEINSEKYRAYLEMKKNIGEEQEKIELRKGVLANIDRSGRPVSEVLVAVPSVFPSNSVINRLSIKRNEVDVYGYLSQSIQLGEIISRTNRSNYFQMPDTPDSLQEGNKFSFSFRIRE